MSDSEVRRIFTVVVADNFHYMDDSEHHEHATFETFEEAVAAARRIVDLFLLSSLKPEMTPEQLYRHYVAFGEDPFIRGPAEGPRFSAWDYAKERCAELCAPVNSGGSS